MEKRKNENLKKLISLDEKEGRRLLKKQIQSCFDFSEGKISLNQLWYRFQDTKPTYPFKDAPIRF